MPSQGLPYSTSRGRKPTRCHDAIRSGGVAWRFPFQPIGSSGRSTDDAAGFQAFWALQGIFLHSPWIICIHPGKQPPTRTSLHFLLSTEHLRRPLAIRRLHLHSDLITPSVYSLSSLLLLRSSHRYFGNRSLHRNLSRCRLPPRITPKMRPTPMVMVMLGSPTWRKVTSRTS